MQTRRRVLLSGLAAASLAGCSTQYPTRAYTGPEVTRILVRKDRRRMHLLHGSRELRRYRIDLGFAPRGHKQFEGDGRTPEGDYHIDRRNPESNYFLSLGVSYPNERDIAFARAQGRDPGGDIFIHGRPETPVADGDWTWGCIAVTNREMAEIYAMVRTHTPIRILA